MIFLEEAVRQLLWAGFLQALADGRISLADSGAVIRQLFPAPGTSQAPLRYTVTKLWVDGRTVENGACLWRRVEDVLRQRECWNNIAEAAGNGRPYFILDKITGEKID